MALGDLLDQIREYYVQRFIGVIEEYELGENDSLIHEVALYDETGELAVEGPLQLPMRIDAYAVRASQATDSIKIETEGMLDFEPVEFEWPEHSMLVDLEPFQWNWLDIKVFGLSGNIDWSPLRTWFLRWFKSADPIESELLGGVHWLSAPQQIDDSWMFSMDLGTAPVAAFEELLDAVGIIGGKRISLGQFDGVEFSP